MALARQTLCCWPTESFLASRSNQSGSTWQRSRSSMSEGSPESGSSVRRKRPEACRFSMTGPGKRKGVWFTNGRRARSSVGGMALMFSPESVARTLSSSALRTSSTRSLAIPYGSTLDPARRTRCSRVTCGSSPATRKRQSAGWRAEAALLNRSSRDSSAKR